VVAGIVAGVDNIVAGVARLYAGVAGIVAGVAMTWPGLWPLPLWCWIVALGSCHCSGHVGWYPVLSKRSHHDCCCCSGVAVA
jgi:hypothetical protein